MFSSVKLDWLIPGRHVLLGECLGNILLFTVPPTIQHVISVQLTMRLLDLLKLIELLSGQLNEPGHNDYINIMEGVLKEESSNVLPSIHKSEA